MKFAHMIDNKSTIPKPLSKVVLLYPHSNGGTWKPRKSGFRSLYFDLKYIMDELFKTGQFFL